MKISKIVLFIGQSYVNWVTFGAIIVIGLPMALYYNLIDYLLYGFTWTTLWGIWCYYACQTMYHFPGYYFIVCYYLKIRLILIEERLNDYRNLLKHLTMIQKISMMRRLIKDHNEICITINKYNMYWKKYLTVTYSIVVILICFISYLVFISNVKWYTRLEYSIVLSAHSLLMIIVTYSASSVSHYNEVLYRNICSLYVYFKFPICVKLEVSVKFFY